MFRGLNDIVRGPANCGPRAEAGLFLSIKSYQHTATPICCPILTSCRPAELTLRTGAPWAAEPGALTTWPFLEPTSPPPEPRAAPCRPELVGSGAAVLGTNLTEAPGFPLLRGAPQGRARGDGRGRRPGAALPRHPLLPLADSQATRQPLPLRLGDQRLAEVLLLMKVLAANEAGSRGLMGPAT